MDKQKILYILNIAKKVNDFSYASMVSAQKAEFDFHISGNWSYTSDEERGSDEKKNDISIHQIDFIRNPYHPKNIKSYFKLKSLIEREKYDVIHCNTPIGGLLGRLAGKKCKVKKVIYQVHGFHFYKGAPKKNWLLYYPIEKWLARYTDVLITINTEDYELAQKKFKLRKGGKIYYVPGVGIDTQQFNSIKVDAIEKRKELEVPDDAMLLLSVGELNDNKNHETVIKAIANLNVYYIIAGVGDKQEYLQELINNLGIADRVKLLGYRTDIPELCKVVDCFVMPSFREGLSRSIMESMASGLPCVVSRIRGNVDLIADGEGGFTVSPSDVDGFTRAISALASDAELRRSMGEKNLERIKDFEISVVIDRMTEIYEKL